VYAQAIPLSSSTQANIVNALKKELETMKKPCPICARHKYISLVDICPICGAPGTKAEIDALCLEYMAAYEWWYDRQEDHRVFGTPLPTVN
jgi:hypothetical protein